MAEKVSEKVEKLVSPIVTGFGYNLVEVVYEKRVDGMNLDVIIDSENGITLSDCEKVHRAIDEPLDELDPTSGKPYTLSVCSPGLDRPLKTDADLKRAVGKTVDVKCFAPVLGKKKFIGSLADFDKLTITLLVDGESVNIERNLVGNISIHLDF